MCKVDLKNMLEQNGRVARNRLMMLRTRGDVKLENKKICIEECRL